MSLSMLVGGGAECGPSNPLQNLTKRFDQDRGVQQDIAGPSRSRGPLSGEVHFRSQNATVPELQQEAARFFGGPAPTTHVVQSSMPMTMPAQPFDVAGLRDALPVAPVSASAAPAQRIQTGPGAGAAWAADFLVATSHRQTPTQLLGQGQAHAQQGQGYAPSIPTSRMEGQHGVQNPTVSVGSLSGGAFPWSSVYAGYGVSPMVGRTSAMAVPMHVVQSDQISWEKEFQSQESLLHASVPVHCEALPEQEQQQSQLNEKGAVPTDEMARLAAQVIDSVKDEQNSKFRDSEFMNLMRQLRDGEVVVDGDNFVPKEEAISTAGIDVKGKGPAVVHDGAVPFTSSRSQVPPSYQGSAELNAAYMQQARDPHEAYFRQENADFTEYWNAHYTGPAAPKASAIEGKDSWDEMQRDWDAFEATATGIKPVQDYQFQTSNPYLVGDSSTTRHHVLHMSRSQVVYENVLELEAAVQRDPTNATAWYELGVKQQENEREAKAIQALERALDLDPTHLPSWLALSVSYTNDNHRQGAYDAVREWVLRNPKYEAFVSGTKLATDRRGDFAGLIDVLIQMARGADQHGGVDADVQIALAVLLNTTEEYTKAVDCFLTALAVRPDDWLLYNRVGATMANNGEAANAIQYYFRALELNPTYIRARFNLGISCINLRRYEEAASHILDALVLQDSDGVQDGTGMNEARGVTSSTLWDSLKTTCLHLQRADLSAMCDRRDLNAFREAFQVL
ncbi:hypothetical protein JVU11DRAFT_2284 [Chiua virens]|nr:hypothetical protein JVU11DRAFT_2284 [Chiua virens]